MSPDRTTMTRAEAIRRRKEEEEKKRTRSISRHISASKPAPESQTSARTRLGWPAASRSTSPSAGSRWRHRYDLAMSMSSSQARRQNGHKSSGLHLNIPRIKFGPRWISFFLVVICFAGIYALLSLDPFIIHGASVFGNQRIEAEEIQTALNIEKMPAIFINPQKLETEVLAAFADISSVKVALKIPNKLEITIEERVPVTAWHNQDGKITWVDAAGYGFDPRGDVQGLPIVTAEANPPAIAQESEGESIGARPFLPAELSGAVSTLAATLPQGAKMIFDPKYGLGWEDPEGWNVYLGQKNGDLPLKMRVYQAMLGYLKQKEIQPTMISVEYPNAPFYQVEQ